MSDDDDEDCPGHVWELQGVVLDERGARMHHRCSLCMAVWYEPSAQDR